MNTNSKKLSKVLLELRNASMQISNEDIIHIVDKYDILFLGEKLNCIYSNELLRSLKNIFHIEISNKELNKLIPIVCKFLNMNCKPITVINHLGSTHSYSNCYNITLW